ncbi:glycerophosphodiester phosphodiesterase family protein [Burkholderia ubonensis]|uniref:glycerophosphodiester phosphodiesterase family protein n=1 Tax=Burkholderia ubonensis TaxID=101571 RepID=UPI0009B49603|nr:glycerophosphodiester phosphodiesterase family protein [Burkholderia ubonensis]
MSSNPVYSKFVLLVLLASALSACAIPARYPVTHPAIVAHRGGAADAPENTLYAIEKAIGNNADAIWITLQLSKDGVVVLYRPIDLKTNTNVSGPVSAYNAEQLARLDAAYYFDPKDGYPLRAKGISIPTLDQVLKTFPHTFFYLDIKSPDADPERIAAAIEVALKENAAMQRVRVYSTESKYIRAARRMPHFETRDETRTALANSVMTRNCLLNEKLGSWYGYELRRDVELTERTTLGESVPSPSTLVWDKNASNCFIDKARGSVLLIGINSAADYAAAANLGATAVLVDSPAQARQWHNDKKY